MSESQRIHLGISTCPNDTFAFHGLLSGEVTAAGLEFDIELHDVEVLNAALLAGEFHVAKGSFATAFSLAHERVVLSVGAALGFGNGPLLLAPAQARAAGTARVILGPGQHTTAELLFRLFHPQEEAVQSVIFSDVMPALVRGDADLGICIHEGRFTFADHGLRCIEDLGVRWQSETGCALPLGGIFARKSLGRATTTAVQAAIEASLAHGRAHPERALESMRAHAQEHSDEVLMQHVQLYVNENTERLDAAGEAAIRRLEQEARSAGLLPADGGELEIFRA